MYIYIYVPIPWRSAYSTSSDGGLGGRLESSPSLPYSDGCWPTYSRSCEGDWERLCACVCVHLCGLVCAWVHQ